MMQKAVFEIKQNATGSYYFTYYIEAMRLLIVSGSFFKRFALENCIAQIREIAPLSAIARRTEVTSVLPLLRIENGEEGEHFKLIGVQGDIVFQSNIYVEQGMCEQAVKALKELSADAKIIDSV